MKRLLIWLILIGSGWLTGHILYPIPIDQLPAYLPNHDKLHSRIDQSKIPINQQTK